MQYQQHRDNTKKLLILEQDKISKARSDIRDEIQRLEISVKPINEQVRQLKELDERLHNIQVAIKPHLQF
jgi:hypothetical protein